MHSLRSKWFAVLLACVFMFAAYGHSPAAELPQTGALAPAEALQLMDTLGDKLTVIDVRTEQEYAQGHVPGALLLPIQTLREHMGQVPADGYAAKDSLAVRDGRFVGLALDDTNEAEQTPGRLAAWAEQLRAAL